MSMLNIKVSLQAGFPIENAVITAFSVRMTAFLFYLHKKQADGGITVVPATNEKTLKFDTAELTKIHTHGRLI